MTDLGKNVIKRLNKERIEPRPQWQFRLKKFFSWSLMVLAILLGTLASSLAIFQITHADWELYHRLDYSFMNYLLLIFPYFWLIFLIIFLYMAYKNYRKTDRGYRTSTKILVLLCILVPFLAGFVVYQTGFSEKLELMFEEKLPLYKNLHFGRHRAWMAPQQGALAGEITAILPAQHLQLKDLRGDLWIIDTTRAYWRGHLQPQVGLKIKLMGREESDRRFTASEIRPFYGRGMGKQRPRRGFRRRRRR